MPSITSITRRSTKAEILEAYEDLLSRSQAEIITPVATLNTAALVIQEAAALAMDLYRAGALSRQWISKIAAELSQPVLKSKA